MTLKKKWNRWKPGSIQLNVVLAQLIFSTGLCWNFGPGFVFLNVVAFSIATYGCESWAMTKNGKKRVDALKMWCYRRLLQTTWKDKRTITWILERIGTDLHLRSGIMKRKYRYFWHNVRRDGGIEEQILQRAVEGKCGKGRPSTS